MASIIIKIACNLVIGKREKSARAGIYVLDRKFMTDLYKVRTTKMSEKEKERKNKEKEKEKKFQIILPDICMHDASRADPSAILVGSSSLRLRGWFEVAG